ncbi:MAG: glycosyltransferase family 39 protein [Anaerolineales bacterium]
MALSFSQKYKAKFSWEGFAVGAILLLGFVLRLRQYLIGRSLWLDEAMLTLNIVNRDFLGLFQPLDYDQGAPIGFLLIEKIINILFGEHEFVLRLFPFAVGVAALGLFYLLLRRTISGVGLLAGLALFAVSPELIYYSAEVKQYILDVAVTIILLYLTYPLLSKKPEKRNYVYLIVAGILVLWFSHAALFVLAGIGFGLLIQALQRRKRSELNTVLTLGVTWLADLGLLYVVSLRHLTQNKFLREYWQENFIPVPPWADWKWFGYSFSGMLQDQIGITVSAWLVFIIIVLGFISLYLKNKTYAGILLAIFFFTSVASTLWLYPLGGRFSLFMVPVVIILISQSLGALAQRLNAQQAWGTLVALLVVAYFLYAPASESLTDFISPKYYEHIRPSMAALSENWQKGDALFVSNGAVPAFRFYAERYGLGEVTYRSSDVSDYLEPGKILSSLEPLDGGARVWVLITHVYEKNSFNEKDYLLNYLDTIGNKKREFPSAGTSVYLFLYDLGQ